MADTHCKHCRRAVYEVGVSSEYPTGWIHENDNPKCSKPEPRLCKCGLPTEWHHTQKFAEGKQPDGTTVELYQTIAGDPISASNTVRTCGKIFYRKNGKRIYW